MSGTTQTPRVHISPTFNDFEIAAASSMLEVVTAAVHARGGCLIALSGGQTPRGIYRHLGDLLVSQSVDLSGVYLIFVDERMVPPEDSESNYGMIRQSFLSRVSLLPSHVFRIQGEDKAESAARDYEREMQVLFPRFGGRCDLIALGVGADGHTASLFPGTEALQESQQSVRAVFVPQLENWRVTLTLPVLNRARTIFFLVAGESKSAIVGKIFAGTHSGLEMPATMVRPDSGMLTWMLDAKAAARLSPVWPGSPDGDFA